MRYFKTPQNDIRAIEPNQTRLIQPDWVELTAEQLAAELEARKPVPTPEQLLQAALAGLTHDFGDGRVIQTRPAPSIDEPNMRNAIELMNRTGTPSMLWKMADNQPHPVTAAELQEAIQSGQDQGAAAWAQYFSQVSA